MNIEMRRAGDFCFMKNRASEKPSRISINKNTPVANRPISLQNVDNFGGRRSCNNDIATCESYRMIALAPTRPSQIMRNRASSSDQGMEFCRTYLAKTWAKTTIDMAAMQIHSTVSPR